MYELSLRKVHGLWPSLKYMFFPWVKVVPQLPEKGKKLQTEEKHELSELDWSGRPMSKVMTTLAIVGAVAATYLAYRYGPF